MLRLRAFSGIGLFAVLVVFLAGAAGCKRSPGGGPGDGGRDGKDGTGGSTCPASGTGTPTKDMGEACTCANECRSGFCADGVCCSTACDETCMSCGLPGSLGTCSATPAGLPPRHATQCAKEGAETCGRDGTCDGNKGCRLYERGSMCGKGTCNGAALEGTFICDGEGTCRLGGTMVCTPFSCDPTTSMCRTSCANDSQCAPGVRCENGSCGKRPNGFKCTKSTECSSGHCVDGFCCNTACDGPCQVCNLVGIEGSCSPTPAGHTHPKCARQDPATCGTTGVCDGFGLCTTYPMGTTCQGGSCSGNTRNLPRVCDGLGSCRPGEAAQCSPFACVNGDCRSKCTSNADCAPDRICDLATGSCGKRPEGQTCTAAGDCLSGFCVDGVCCNEACGGTCRSCNLSGTAGRCVPVPDGMIDPRAPTECMDQGPASCGTDGRCDGAGACRKYPVGFKCAAATCANDVATPESTCNAAGQCVKPRSISCFPYRCNVDQCFTSCSTNAQCVDPNVCGQTGAGSCGKKGLGQPCGVADECSSGFCAQGFCCNSACTAACQTCDLPATRGTCSPVQSGADNRCPVQAASTCGNTGQCSGGRCAQHPVNTTCRAASCAGMSTYVPPSTCNGSGTCVTPANVSCAPGRCEGNACTNVCSPTVTTPVQCTAPATCVGESCGLVPRGGSCTTTSMCQSGLTCAQGVCCDRACNGICETCRPQGGQAGVCTLLPAGADDPTDMCATNMPSMCGTNGRCNGVGTVATTPNTTAARCQSYGTETGCRAQSCTPGATGSAPATMTLAATCDPAMTSCPAVQTQSCTPYRQCNGNRCADTCQNDSDCVPGVACNTQTKKCGDKLPNGQACSIAADCTSGNCVEGVCCNVALAMCQGPCRSCSTGTCTNAPGSMACGTASCTGSQETLVGTCSGGSCVQMTRACPGNLVCGATMCLASCMTNAHCLAPFSECGVDGTCKKPLGAVCSNGGECGTGNCVDGRCCGMASCPTCTNCGATGTCNVNVAAGTADTTPGATMCTNQGGCGTNGMCNGSGACAIASAGTSCTGTMTGCASTTSVYTAAGMCSGTGAGMCVQGTTPCGPCQTCTGGSSGTCASTCSPSEMCVADTCVPIPDGTGGSTGSGGAGGEGGEGGGG